MKLCMVALGVGKTKGNGICGGVKGLVNLLKPLASMGHKIHMVTTYPVYYDADYAVQLEGVQVYYVGQHPFRGKRHSLLFLAKAVKKITELHRREGFDLVCGHSSYPELALIPLISGKINRLPKVHILGAPIQQKRFFSQLWAGSYLSHLDMVIAPSNNVAYSLTRILPGERIYMIPPCIDTDVFSPAISDGQIREEFGLGEAPVLLSLDSGNKRKGTEVLLSALKSVRKNIPEVRLLMGLDTPLEGYWRQRLELKDKIKSAGLERNIVPLGPANNIEQIMAACDIFVAPFISMAGVLDSPLSILEAMGCGKPVIASRIGGITEIIRDGRNGILVEPGDALALADGILSLLKNKDKAKRMGLEAAKYIGENFRVDTAARMLAGAFEEVISKKRNQRLG